MSDKSGIEWTDATWNPVRGCDKVSPGCKHCYAETFAERWRGVPGHAYEQGFDLRLVPHLLTKPLRWSKPRKIFVNSMSDLLHERVPLDYVGLVAEVMLEARWHEFQLLTKRAERLVAASEILNLHAPHVLVGVSVEDRKYGLPRIEALRSALVRHRFLSIEPLLEDLGDLDLEGIGWVIVGGESGRGARPMDPAWVRRIRDQCSEQDVPFLFKQWGGVIKKDHGRELDGLTYDGWPRTVAGDPRPATDRAREIARIDRLVEALEPRLLAPSRRRSLPVVAREWRGHGAFPTDAAGEPDV